MGRVAIVTDASRGIGRATAIRLAGDFSVVALAVRTQEILTKTADAIRAAGARLSRPSGMQWTSPGRTRV